MKSWWWLSQVAKSCLWVLQTAQILFITQLACTVLKQHIPPRHFEPVNLQSVTIKQQDPVRAIQNSPTGRTENVSSSANQYMHTNYSCSRCVKETNAHSDQKPARTWHPQLLGSGQEGFGVTVCFLTLEEIKPIKDTLEFIPSVWLHNPIQFCS